MDLFNISKLLLMALLLQPSENADWETHTLSEPDDSVHFGEFCLRISDDPQMRPESVTQLPTKTAHPTKRSTQLSEQPTTEPTHQDSQSNGPPAHPNTHFRMMNLFGPSSLITEEGCRCQEGEGELPAETSQFKNMFTSFPSESCNLTKTIVTLWDNRVVCVTVPSPFAYFDKFFRDRSEPATEAHRTEKPLVPTPAPLDPATELPLTTLSPETEAQQFYGPSPQTTLSSNSKEIDYSRTTDEFENDLSLNCESCNFNTSMDSVDLKAVQFLNLKIQPVPCPININVSLKDDTHFCLDSDQQEFRRMLEHLDIPPPVHDDFNPTAKDIIDGCRCKEKEHRPLSVSSEIVSTKIWFPSETCNSTEFIETRRNAGEVCVTTPSLSAYLQFVLPTITQPTVSNPVELESMPEENEYHAPPVLRDEIVLQFDEDVGGDIVHPCISCIPFENWNDVDPKDVQSLEMDGGDVFCPVLFFVHMKNKVVICADWSHPGFKSLLENLRI